MTTDLDFNSNKLFFCGGFFCSPAKGCKFIKRKEEEKERKREQKKNLEKKKGKVREEKSLKTTANFGKQKTKFAS